MKAWQYALLIILVLAVIGAILFFVPQTNSLVRGVLQVLAWIWMALKGLILFVLIIAFGGIVGWLFKYFGISWLDDNVVADEGITGWGHFGIAVVLGLLMAVIQTLLMPVVMAWNTWMRVVAIEFGWSGVYETLPIWWFIVPLIEFVIVYMVSPYYFGQTETCAN